MGLLERFRSAKTMLDTHPAVHPPRWAEDWVGRPMPGGVKICPGRPAASLDTLLAAYTVTVPSLLKEAWCAADGFAGVWDCRYRDRAGKERIHSLGFGLLPAAEALCSTQRIRQLQDQPAPRLLAGQVLDPARFAAHAPYGYQDTTHKTPDTFAEVLENALLLECFSVDLQFYTVFKCDAPVGTPSLFLAYEHGLYPLQLDLAGYFDAMFEVLGACWPWPLLFVDPTGCSPSMQRSLNDARRLAEDVRAALGR